MDFILGFWYGLEPMGAAQIVKKNIWLDKRILPHSLFKTGCRENRHHHLRGKTIS